MAGASADCPGGKEGAGQLPSRNVHVDVPPPQGQRTEGMVVAGICAGSISSVLCSPLDVAKTRIQVQGSLGGHAYHGLVGSLREIHRAEGPSGFFLGLGPTLMTVPLFWGIYFPLYTAAKARLAGVDLEGRPREAQPWQHCAAAVAAGCVSDTVTNPLWVTRTRYVTDRLHLQGGAAGETSVRSLSTLGVMRHLVRTEGFFSLYKGLTASLLGVSHVAIQFPIYERLKKAARSRSPDGVERVPDLLLASAASKVIASTATYPHEVLRARMQDTRTPGHVPLLGTLRRVVAAEGYGALYNGLSVNLVRVMPACAVTFLAFELINRRLQGWLTPTDRAGAVAGQGGGGGGGGVE